MWCIVPLLQAQDKLLRVIENGKAVEKENWEVVFSLPDLVPPI